MTEPHGTEGRPELYAVIDIGATSVRMMIAQVSADGTIANLENLSQTVHLARDSFVSGRIRRATIEECVQVLKMYRSKLNEYGFSDADHVRVVATSAVREAANRLAFVDRVYIATGFDIEPFDEAQLHRVTFLGIQPILEKHPGFLEGQTLICEVGGGSTETLLMRDGQVVFARTWRLGVLRLIHSLASDRAALKSSRHLLESGIAQTVNQIASMVDRTQPVQFMILGSEARLAAREIRGRESGSLQELGLAELQEFTNGTLKQSPDRLVARYQLGIQEAASLGPALLINSRIADSLGVDRLWVARVNLRDGLIHEMVSGQRWSGAARDQIIGAALALGRKFGIDEAHARHVARLATDLFHQTAPVHQLRDKWEITLHAAALLHEVGLAISERSYHKHSQYIIRNSVFFGVSSSELDLIALVARYHRRALPQRTHEIYSSLSQDDRALVARLAALVRIAKVLDVGRKQAVTGIRCHISGRSLVIEVEGLSDLALEQVELRREQELFEYVFGLAVELTPAAGPMTPVRRTRGGTRAAGDAASM
jgi:exopolyphosphatase/guanosine-5'-triphosphate,3'-diphosphate pyrophosphatase